MVDQKTSGATDVVGAAPAVAMPAGADTDATGSAGTQRAASDSGGLTLTAGRVTQLLLADLVPKTGRALLVGAHASSVVAAVAERLSQVTVLLPPQADPESVSSASPRNVQVVAGALDGLAAPGQDAGVSPRFDLVMAAEGLDDVLPIDGVRSSWQDGLEALAARVVPGGALVVGLTNPRPLSALVPGMAEEKGASGTGGSDGEDETRPASVRQLQRALAAAGHRVSTAHCLFGDPADPACIVSDGVAERARAGTVPARLALRALAPDTPDVAPSTDHVRALLRAGLLPDLSSAWIAVCGANGRPVYARLHDGRLAWADVPRGTSQWTVQPIGTDDAPDGAPLLLPSTPDIEAQLRRHMDSDDLPAFKAVAARLGEWARSAPASEMPAPLGLDDLFVDGGSHLAGLGLGLERTPGATGPELLAGAWHRFGQRLAKAGARRPSWATWSSEADQLRLYLTMSGLKPTPELLERGRLLGTPGAADRSDLSDGAYGPDRAASDADSPAPSAETPAPADGQAVALKEAIDLRDAQLRVREQVIRSLRRQVWETTRDRDTALSDLQRLRGSSAYRLAVQLRTVALVRHPKKFARAVAVRGVKTARRFVRAYRQR